MLKYHIQTIELAGSAEVTFTSIPQTFDDLLLVYSLRGSNTNVPYSNARLFFNGSTSNLAARRLFGGGSGSGESYTDTNLGGLIASANSTSNTFGSSQLYVSNYAGSQNKPYSIDSVSENNATSAYQEIIAGLWSQSSPLTSITIQNESTTSFTQYSSASLYGIKRGADGVTKSSPVAQGGTVTTAFGYTIHTFTGSGTFNLLRPATVDYLVVAGGGSGGATTSLVDYNTGAGGAGGYRYLSSQVLSAGTYSVVVGAGGSVEGTGTPGNNSSFFTTSATGGGAGGSGGGSYIQPTSGGSGGGGGTPGTLTAGTGNAGGYSPVEGYAGGNGNSGGAGSTSGGGGGAGGAGGTPTAGPGAPNSITGSNVTYATGGTGLSGGGTGSASNAAANTGNGGNAGRSQRFVSGLGGSGVVIIRYLTPA